MAVRLCGLGWSVAVCDTDPRRQTEAAAAGARLCASPQALAAQLAPDGVLLVVLVDAAQCQQTLLGEAGALAAMSPGQSVFLCPTLGPDQVEALGQAVLARGLGCLDAPMSGGPQRAREGQMSLMLAGSRTLLQTHARLLGDLAASRFEVGPRLGDAARTKLVNNLLAATQLVAAAEAMALAEGLGLDAATTLAVIERSSGQSWIGSDRMRRALAGDWSPRAHLTLLEKDTRLALQAAEGSGFEPRLGALAASVFQAARAAGWADFDDAALLPFLRGDCPDGTLPPAP